MSSWFVFSILSRPFDLASPTRSSTTNPVLAQDRRNRAPQFQRAEMTVALITGGSEGAHSAEFPRCTSQRASQPNVSHLPPSSSFLPFPGIGLATAIKLASQGVHVAICGRTADKLEAAAAQVKKLTGQTILAIVADVRTRQECEKAVNLVSLLCNGGNAAPLILICAILLPRPPKSSAASTSS